MKNRDTIILIDDDEDDIAIIKDAISELGLKKEIFAFTDAREALAFFRKIDKSPLFILCDVNMPAMDGFELRRIIYSDNVLLLRATPFIFLSTSPQIQLVNQAIVFNAQGYFKKPVSFDAYVVMLRSIISYWEVALPPDMLVTRHDSSSSLY